MQKRNSCASGKIFINLQQMKKKESKWNNK